MRRLPPAGERGNVTPVVIGLVALILMLVLGLADLGTFFLARSKAQTAADSAALAAAAELIPGGGAGDPERQAARFAQANGARLLSCACRRGDRVALVRVALKVRFGLLPRPEEVTARARADVDLEALRVRTEG